MSTLRPTAKEIVKRGQALYETRIRPIVEQEHFGRIGRIGVILVFEG